jgi:hypothetical protein
MCQFGPKDCVVDVPFEDLTCLGEGCSVRIKETPIILQECWNLAATYLQVDFECISSNNLIFFGFF